LKSATPFSSVVTVGGKLPKFSHSMEYGWFQKSLYTAFSELNSSGVKREGLIFGQHPFTVYNALRNCVRFTTARLIALQEDLLAMERSLKTSGASSPRLLLENFLLKACS
jgi:DNA polymerase III delta subunit